MYKVLEATYQVPENSNIESWVNSLRDTYQPLGDNKTGSANSAMLLDTYQVQENTNRESQCQIM
jgi:hypothetical protein